MRRVTWFSCGAASAIAAKLSNPDEIVYCETGSEDADNARFMRDCQDIFNRQITTIKSEKYQSTWDVWERRKYISGVAGAPCTSELKIAPRLAYERPDDVHIFGYTADASDVRRAKMLRENWPDLKIETPLIDKGLTKAACIAMIENLGITPPACMRWAFPMQTASRVAKPQVHHIGHWSKNISLKNLVEWQNCQKASMRVSFELRVSVSFCLR